MSAPKRKSASERRIERFVDDWSPPNDTWAAELMEKDLRRLLALERKDAAEPEANEHAASRAAMWLWSAEYSKQNDGATEWYAKLPESRKRLALECADHILRAAIEGRKP